MSNSTSVRKKKRAKPTKHVPIRTCIGCGRKDAKRSYVRLVRTPEYTVEVDGTGNRNGRGTYLCARRSCWYRALDSDAIEKALKIELDLSMKDALREYARTHFPPETM